jgi:hypothetical protein
LGFAAPPRCDRRQSQCLPQQALRGGRHEPHPRGRFEHAAAEAVGEHHPARTHHADETGHAERRVGAQFHRVAEIVVQAAHDGVHSAQAAERFQIDGVAAYGEVMALDQRQTQLTRQIGVFEIGFVERARGEHDRQGRFRVGRVSQ